MAVVNISRITASNQGWDQLQFFDQIQIQVNISESNTITNKSANPGGGGIENC